MSLSSDLISQFVKATKDTSKPSTETTVQGTTVIDSDGRTWVKLDGSDLLTPVSTTADAEDGERVTVLIKDHTATITGNTSSPAARKESVDNLGTQITELDVVLAYKVSTEELEAANATIDNLRALTVKFSEMEAVTAEIETLYAKFATLDYVTAKDVEAINADIENLRAKFGEFTSVSTEDLDAMYAEIDTLKGYTADYTYVSADRITAMVAQIKTLDTEKLSAEQADIKYANVEFANITEAAVKKIFSDYGVIKELVIEEGTVVKELIGVTIKGDLIEANTLKADKLVVKGSDGLYYKLNFEAGVVAGAEVTDEELQNGLHGSTIIANTITAEKIRVDDLVAFGATIGGFHINAKSNNPGSIHSGVKSSPDNTTRGIYLDTDGQVAFGDETNYVKFYKDVDDKYKLDISADSVRLSTKDVTIEEMVEQVENDINNIEIGGRNLIVRGTSTEGQYIGDDGSIVTEDSYECSLTDYISITPNDEYTFSRQAGSGDYFRIAWYDENQNFLGNHVITEIGVNESGSYVWTAPDTAKYLRVSYPTNSESGAKLEKGNKATDYTPAPEDMATATDINELTGTVLSNSESIANLKLSTDSIVVEVGEIKSNTDDAIAGLADRVTITENSVSAAINAEQAQILITQTLSDTGAGKVTTTTGVTVDSDGIRVEQTGADTWTQIDETGMTVFESETGIKALTATSSGVDARNLHATTYLIVGQNSRFEDYGEEKKRTGCFWIGN